MDSQDSLVCAPEHSVQFYEDDAFLIDQLGRFIDAGLHAGESAIVLATKIHRDQLKKRFRVHPSIPSDAGDRYMVLDAADTLSEIMTEGVLNTARFVECVGGLIDRAARAGNGRVRIFGELVALLWTSGQEDVAVQLEQLWNTLARTHSFSLFCAYPIRGFSRNEHTVGFQDICAAHSIVHPAESFQTQVGTELVNRVVAQLQQKAHALETEVGRRKQVEITLRRREEELADFLENGAECLHQVGPDGRILWANKAELALLGYEADEYIGHHIAEFHVDAGTIADILRRLLNGETLYDYPARLRCKNGSVKDVLIHSNARWEEGSFHYTRCFTRDISERKRMDEELDRRVEERTRDLIHSQHRLRALASELSLAEQRVRKDVATELHDYLAQLLVVLRLKLFQANQQVDDRKLAALLEEADRVLDESILYTRSLMADLNPPVLQFGLPMGLRWLADKLQSNNLAVAVDIPDGAPLDLTENQIGLIFQSVRELLMNVVKHAGTDQARLSLRIHGENIHIEVADNGLGFDPAILPTTLDTKNTITQFGLFSIRERMEALGGRFDLHSAPQGGTRAVLVLPLGPSVSKAAQQPSTAAEGPSGVVTFKGQGAIRVLLVDDHVMVRQGLRGVLESYPDIEVVEEAADGQAAVELARACLPDVVVMDVNLPTLDGVEATRLIKAERPSTIVIGLSVHQAGQIEHVLREAGASAYVAKGEAGENLYEAIVKAVRGPAAGAPPDYSGESLSPSPINEIA